MPGIDEEIDGAIQQAAHPTRHSIIDYLPKDPTPTLTLPLKGRGFLKTPPQLDMYSHLTSMLISFSLPFKGRVGEGMGYA
jgi:hypothetical protein